MAASLQDVARMVGVSISTVSRALHRPEMVDAATRERINVAVAALGYVPQGVGRALVSRRTRSIGAVVPSIGVSAFGQTIEALRQGLGMANYTLLLAQPSIKEQADLSPLRTLIERGVDGIVLLGNDCPPPWIDLITKNDLPFATIWADSGNALAGAIGFDNYVAGRKAAEHLLDLGHREFAFISGHLAFNQRARQRYQGLLETIAAGGGRLSRDLIAETDYGFAEGYQATKELLGKRLKFSALICGNDYLALGATACLREHGLSIPNEVSVIGFNDSQFSAFVDPPLTTIHFPSVEIGMLAAKTLLAAIDSTEPMPPPQMLPTFLVKRSSTGPAA
ncbi:LacI family DNA-binding transcriptional regulator [Pusillimonas sp. MFBS29]|uniref:LacI family DNA-binding transcriptional regulator n=1 Tax=Pusillimonas sp. MFBS29 TaxID=2886690 RepID=UPI001D1090D5|nr:LacI family DNA-binding transcriptional regulator [Pusillimonas sp. MFBS29]MCC2595868.1 LacI family DNA-binding transcriptional regulator [Pusillimonas sp. MFBS29]